MGKMNSFQVSIAYWTLKSFIVFMQALPSVAALWVGRRMGDAARVFNPKGGAKVLSNLRIAFGATHSSDEIKRIEKDFFTSYGQNLVEVARLPLIARRGYKEAVDVVGHECLGEIMARGKGCIFLSMHSGNWELSNVVGSMSGYPYNMVANPLDNADRAADLLNALRQSAGCRIINPGIGGREIIRCLKRNEIVTLVADQGGAEGVVVPFFGKGSSMSTGAVRLALKYGVPILVVNICRVKGGKHLLTVRPFDVVSTGNDEEDIKNALASMSGIYEEWIRKTPAEYLWLYKTWKCSTERTVVILDDGRTGHLRQSESVARSLVDEMILRGMQVRSYTCRVEFRSPFHAKLLTLMPNLLALFGVRGFEDLRSFLTEESYARLFALKPDHIVSTGSLVAAINDRYAAFSQARSIVVMRPGNVPLSHFSCVVMPKHDALKTRGSKNVVCVEAAPNLINEDYLRRNAEALRGRSPSLQQLKDGFIGVLIGGDAKGVVMSERQMRTVVLQLKEMAVKEGKSLLVTTSRRTPVLVEEMIEEELKGFDHTGLLILAGKNNVPEAVGGILGLADLVVVSGESVSMVSEAASSGRPTLVFGIEGDGQKCAENKYTRFVKGLAEAGFLVSSSSADLAYNAGRMLRGDVKTRVLNDSETIKQALRKIVQ
jgi:Kdo2-lipid IVA lauroyltransferase/acyltransferase